MEAELGVALEATAAQTARAELRAGAVERAMGIVRGDFAPGAPLADRSPSPSFSVSGRGG